MTDQPVKMIDIVVVVPEVISGNLATADIKTHTIKADEFLDRMKVELFTNSLYPDGFDRPRIFDVASLPLGSEKRVDIWVDDEGLYRNTHEIDGEPHALGFWITTTHDETVFLAGALAFASCDTDGNTCSSPLTSTEIGWLLTTGRIQIAAMPSYF